ncbi:carboxyl transferase domain-containing protein [Streptosporangium saharense]|uniref:carboxyl transferase domain-containing protein n=1 Tax=Streptosporangium saharense TaxID=1706840 RepID=UPI0036AF6A0F
MTVPHDAGRILDVVLDRGSFVSWDAPVTYRPADPAYAAALARARADTGLDEAVVTGEGRVGGRRIAVVVSEFGFLAGSVGAATADRLTAAVRRATAERLPLLAAPASGGTRMQEGTAAFVRMAAITAAVEEHKAARLPYLVYLRHPTTGGVLASWGSLGHVTLAEPEALIGFLGPRVYEALGGTALPEGVQGAENLLANGVVDLVVAPELLAGVLAPALDVLAAVPGPPPAPAVPDRRKPRSGTAWESMLISRASGRPGVRRLLEVAATGPVSFGDPGSGLLVALARLHGEACVVVGQDRYGGPLGPRELRRARRGMRMAADLGLPLVTVVDTGGAELSREAEEGGLAAELAHCLADLVTLPTPTVSVLLGQGAGGAALALLPADRIVAAEHGWLSPLPPEGASALVHRTTERAADLARAQRITAPDLAEAGLVDDLVVEPEDGDEFCHRIAAATARAVGLVRGAGTGGRRRSGRFAVA